MMRELIVCDSPLAAMLCAADHIRTWVAHLASPCIALAGGKTPLALYEYWAKQIPDDLHETFLRAHFFWGDERLVSSSDPRSNQGQARNAFLKPLHIPDAHIHGIRTDACSAQESAEHYAQEIRQSVPTRGHPLPSFDLVCLGMGADGHTASLFPNTPAVSETKNLVVATEHPETGEPRISLTLPCINHARHVLFLVTGEDKADAVRNIWHEKDARKEDYPAGCVQPERGSLLWVVDQAAASRL